MRRSAWVWAAVLGMSAVAGPVDLFGSQGVPAVVAAAPDPDEVRVVAPAVLWSTSASVPTVDGDLQGTGTLGKKGTLVVPVAGRAGLPVAGVTAVRLLVAMPGAHPSTQLAVFPAGGDRGTGGDRLRPKQDGSPVEIVREVDAEGRVEVLDQLGGTEVAVSLTGWWGDEPIIPVDDGPWAPSTSAELEVDEGSAAPPVVLPEHGTQVVVAGATPVQAGRLPVWVSRTDPTAPPVRLRVEAAPEAVAEQAGADVVLVQVVLLTPVKDPAAFDPRVTVSIDWSGFRHLYGGDWSERLAVERFPACATAARPAGTEACGSLGLVPSVNDLVAGDWSASVYWSMVNAYGDGIPGDTWVPGVLPWEGIAPTPWDGWLPWT